MTTLGKTFNRIDLLQYHVMGAVTYRRLGREYQLEDIPAVPRERMIGIRDRMIARGAKAVLA